MERMERQSTHVLWHFSCLLWWFLAAWTSYFVSQGKLWTKGVRNSDYVVWTAEVHQGLLHKALAVLYFLLKFLFLKPVHSAGSLLDDTFVSVAQHKAWLLLWVNTEQNDSLRIDHQYPMVKCLSDRSTFYTYLKTKQNSHSKAYFKTRVHAKSCFACSCPSAQAELLGFAFWYSFVQ